MKQGRHIPEATVARLPVYLRSLLEVAEVKTTGPGAPTASQPAGPCVTLVSARRPVSAPASG